MEDSVSEPASAYWVVVVDELLPPPPELRSFDTFDGLVDFIKSVHRDRKSAWVLPFFGDVLSVTDGGINNSLRFLVDPFGVRVPLFDIPDGKEEGSKRFYPAGGREYVDILSKAFNAEETPRIKNVFREPPPRRFEFIDDSEGDGSDLDFNIKEY